MIFEKGRPADESGRLAKEIRVYDLLDSLGIDYSRADHEVVMTMEACKKVTEVTGIDPCKNLFLCNRQETDFYLLLMPGDKPFRTKDLSAQLGVARLSFAKPEHMDRLLDLTPGSASIMGLMNDTEHHVQLLVDEDVLKDEYVGCHPCVNTSSLKLRTADVFGTFLRAVGHNMKTVHLVGED